MDIFNSQGIAVRLGLCEPQCNNTGYCRGSHIGAIVSVTPFMDPDLAALTLNCLGSFRVAFPPGAGEVVERCTRFLGTVRTDNDGFFATADGTKGVGIIQLEMGLVFVKHTVSVFPIIIPFNPSMIFTRLNSYSPRLRVHEQVVNFSP